MEDSENKWPIDIIREMNPGVFISTGQELADIIKNKEANEKMEEPKVFTPIQKSVIKIILVQVLTGRGKVVEDISQAINSMFPLTEQQIKDVDNIVTAVKSETDDNKVKTDLYKMQEILAKDVPMPILYATNELFATNKRVVVGKPKDYGTFINVYQWDVK